MIIENGIGYSKRGQAAYITGTSGNPDQRDVKQPIYEDLASVNLWAHWGDDNQLPITMAKTIESCGVLMSAIDGKARFGLGRGVKPFRVLETKPDGEEVLEPVSIPEIDDWLEESNMFFQSFALFKDMIGFGNYHGRFKFNNGGDKIGLFLRDDVTEFRYEKDKDGIITKTFLCADWSKYPKVKDRSLVETPLLPSIGPASYLMSMAPEQRKAKEFAITGRLPGWNRHYYSMPTWYAAKKWVDIAMGVPDMKSALFENNIRLKYLVVVYDEYWNLIYGSQWAAFTPEQKAEKKEELFQSIDDWLVGSQNAYKTVYIPGKLDPITGKGMQYIEIKPIEDTTKQGELLPDSAAANSEILFALMMNPALMGADTPGGPYSGGAGSGSNIREAALVQVMIQEFERQQISRILNIVKKVNGWPADIVWRFPGLVLTTLDTGKSTKPVQTGG
jgi:hypothetical protein